MYTQISDLIAALEKCGALGQSYVRSAIKEFAACLEDEDYRTHLLGELATKLAEAGFLEEAESLVRRLAGLEKSTFMVKIAEAEFRLGQEQRAVIIYNEACEAAFAHRFPTQRSQAVASIAQSVEKYGEWKTSAVFWSKAVEMAQAGQTGAGTDVLEAAGVLVDAAEAFSRHGERSRAEQIAQTIVIDDLRSRALKNIL